MIHEGNEERLRKILLSFSPKYYEVLKNGNKVFEYRKRFCDEEVMAYIYIGRPIQKIVGVAKLGRRIDLDKWYREYSETEIRKRIADFMTRNKYAMPIISFQEIEPIMISEIKKAFPKFYIPLSFRNLEPGDEISSYIESKQRFIGEIITHDFSTINPQNICEM